MVIQTDLISRDLGATDLELGLGREPEFRVFIRDNNFYRVDQLKEWISFSFISRFNKVGTWQLVISANSLAARVFRENYGIIVTREVEGTEKVIFSGSIGTQWEETTETISIAGWCDNKFLETTARPTPTLAQGPYPDEYYTITGQASSVMRTLVAANIGPGSPTEWRINGLDVADDPLLGGIVTARARFDPLLTLLAELASTGIATGLGFQIIQADDIPGQLEFRVYEPRDKHIDTVFSVERQTARDYKRTYTAPLANYFQVAGGDDFGINRTVVEGGDEESIAQVGRRIVQFIDRRGVTDVSELEQELAELIATAVSSNTIEIYPANIPAYQYGVDYDLGDYVTAIVRGTAYPRIITSVEVALDPQNGVSITPTISDPYNSEDDLLVQHLNSLSHRLSNIERNWNIPDNSLIPDMFHETIRPMVGDIKMTARNSSQPGWLVCDGLAINRSVYGNLYLAIGTLYGIGDNSTTFNIPNFDGRGPIGVGDDYGLGEIGGTDTIDLNFGTHHHNHSHGGGNLVFVHTHNERTHIHPGSHSHTLIDHYHSIGHSHTVRIPTHNTGKRVNDSTLILGFEEPNISSGVEDHIHNVPQQDVSTLGDPVGSTSGNSIRVTTGGLTSTEPDSTAHAAVYTGVLNGPNVGATWTGGTDPDGTTASISATGINVKNRYTVVNFLIYTGVVA